MENKNTCRLDFYISMRDCLQRVETRSWLRNATFLEGTMTDEWVFSGMGYWERTTACPPTDAITSVKSHA